jgi:hypothetical protein
MNYITLFDNETKISFQLKILTFIPADEIKKHKY